MSNNDFPFFRKLYEEYRSFEKDFFLENYRYWVGNENVSLNKARNGIYAKIKTFLCFLDFLRTIYYSGDIFEAIKKHNEDIWFGYEILSFLLNKDLIKIKNGRVIFKESFDEFFIKQLSEAEIIRKLKRKLKRKLELEKPMLYNLVPNSRFKWKSKYDQIPITTKSAISILSKISQYYPIKASFAFIGDDDFLSIPFSIIFNIPTFSLDKDKSLLSEVEGISKKLGLNIKVIEADFVRTKKVENFYGCYTNPPYNYFGPLKFLSFILHSLEKEGIVFMVLGSDMVGRRFVHLQKEIANLGFSIKEIFPSSVSYRFHLHHKEDELIYKKMKSLGIDIKEKETLFASLYVLEHVGNVKKVSRTSNIYSYV